MLTFLNPDGFAVSTAVLLSCLTSAAAGTHWLCWSFTAWEPHLNKGFMKGELWSCCSKMSPSRKGPPAHQVGGVNQQFLEATVRDKPCFILDLEHNWKKISRNEIKIFKASAVTTRPPFQVGYHVHERKPVVIYHPSARL